MLSATSSNASYGNILKELDTIIEQPVPSTPTQQDYDNMLKIRDTLKAIPTATLNPTEKMELGGAIDLAEMRLVDLVHAKK